MVNSIRRQQRWAALCAIVIIGLLSSYVMLVYLQRTGTSLGSKHDHISFIIDNSARKPVAYRMLAPTLVRAADTVTPDGIKQAVTTLALKISNSPWAQRLFVNDRLWQPLGERYLFGYVVLNLLNFAGLVGAAWMVWKLASALFPESRAYAWAAPIVMLLGVPPLHSFAQYHYDYLTLFFMAAGLYALYLGKSGGYLLIFALATLNRETSILLTLVAASWCFRRMERKAYWLFIGGQLAIYLLMQGWIHWHYQDHSGGGLKFVALNQLGFLSHGYGFQTYMLLLAVTWLLTYHFREKPLFLRHTLWLWPAAWAGYMAFGFPREYRVLYELLPGSALLATHTLITAAGIAGYRIFRPPG